MFFKIICDFCVCVLVYEGRCRMNVRRLRIDSFLYRVLVCIKNSLWESENEEFYILSVVWR